MKVLVTGGNGFIGQAVLAELSRRGHTPLIFDRHAKSEHFDFFLGDIRDATAVTEAMAHAEGYIHLAGVLGTAETIFNPRPAAETNILGGLNVLEAASQYDIPGVNIAVGNHWMNNTYSITKSSVERFAQMFRDERSLRVTNVRALNAYGPGQSVAYPFGDSKVRKIMPSFVCRALSGLPIEIYGDGSQIMDMIYVDDVARILVKALEYTAKEGPVFHTIEAGTGRPTTVTDIALAVADEVTEIYGKDVEINYLPMRPGEPLKSVVMANTETLTILEESKDSLLNLENGLVPTVYYFHDYLKSREQDNS